MKNINFFKIIIIFTLIVTFAIAIFALCRKKEPQNRPLTPKSEPTNIVVDKVFSPVIYNNQKDIIYYNTANGRLEKYNIPSGKVDFVSSELFSDVSLVSWNHDNSKVILLSSSSTGTKNLVYFVDLNDLNNPKISIYEGASKFNFTWSPDSKKVAYQYIKEDKVILSISEPGGQNWENIIELAFDDASVKIAWPTNNQISILKYASYGEEYNSPSPMNEKNIFYQVDIANKKIIENNDLQNVTSFKYSPSGNNLAYFIEDQIDLFKIKTSDSTKEIKLQVESADNLYWYDDNTLYALKSNEPYRETSGGSFSLNKIDVNTGSISEIAKFSLPGLDKANVLSNVLFLKNLSFVFFTNIDRLYGVPISKKLKK